MKKKHAHFFFFLSKTSISCQIICQRLFPLKRQSKSGYPNFYISLGADLLMGVDLTMLLSEATFFKHIDADIIVSDSGVFEIKDYEETIAKMRKAMG